MASNLIVVAFDSVTEAQQALEALKDGRKQGVVQINDAAVIEKDTDGSAHVRNQISHGTWAATGIGGLLGLLLGGIFFPVAGLAMGLAGGALVGRMMDLGVDGKFVKDVEAELQPGTSALFVLLGTADATAVLAILRQFQGRVLQTTLSSETEESLRQALGEKE